MDRTMLEIYSDYLISSFGQTSTTVLSRLLDNTISHDQITRFLEQGVAVSRTLWLLAKPLVRRIEREDGVISIDDCVQPKPHSRENGVIEWFYDHSVGQTVKGMNILTAFYSVHSEGPTAERLGVPVGCEVIVKKPVWDDKKQTTVMKSTMTKQQQYRELLKNCKANDIKYKYVLNDTWFTNAENMNFIDEVLKKKFVMAIKENMIATMCDDKDIIVWRGPIRDVPSVEGQVCRVYLNGVDFPVWIAKHVFKNKDGSTGTLYLCTNDPELDGDQMLKVYQRRWPIEEFHKSLKQNASLAKCPASRPELQIKHVLCCLYGYVKLEWMKITHGRNHFELRSRMYLAALRASSAELQVMRTQITSSGFTIA